MRVMVNSFVLFLFLISMSLYAEEAMEEQEGRISYFEIAPSLVTNLSNGGKYVRTSVQLVIRDDAFKTQLEYHAPAIRHTLLMVLSEQDGSVLKTPDGKEALRNEALSAVQNLLRELTGQDEVQDLLFTTFFVQ